MNPQRTLRFAVVYTAIWTPVALAFSLALNATRVLPLTNALLAGVACTLPAALLGLPVVAFSSRVPPVRLRTLKLVGWHAVAGIGFSSLWALSIIVLVRLLSGASALHGFLRDGLAWQLLMGVLTYAVIAGVASSRAAFRRQEEQARAAERAQTLRLSAELEALRARLDPHFLFNVLQTIGALVDQQPKDTHRALEHLASLLKRRLVSSRDAGDDATLAEELQDVREYCELERLRLGARLEWSEDIDPSLLHLTMPRFTLQPLVENAIRHGIAPRSAPGCLTLRAVRRGDGWTMSVSDNGVGAAPADVAIAQGLGISVVRERIALRFGGRSRFDVNTARGEGFAVTIQLPVEGELVVDEYASAEAAVR